ncbi:MAG TPA: DUF6580 family putative transport protein [Candidatus Saccharimonadales bacterium]|nr:DUF6580 family putative transport protein [Candidatus Saccharimonadales bacterium]
MEVRVNRLRWRLVGVALALIAFGVVMRLLPHPANMAPVGAIALFGGAVLPKRLAWWLPLAIMVVSDCVLGFYHGIGFTWLGFLLVGLYGMSLRPLGWMRLPAGVAGSSVIFFVVSNFGVWIAGQLYPHTWAGLVQCYTLALPFFRGTFLGDLAYSALFFGVYALAAKRWALSVSATP